MKPSDSAFLQRLLLAASLAVPDPFLAAKGSYHGLFAETRTGFGSISESANRFAWQHTLKKLRANQPVTLLFMGNSMADGSLGFMLYLLFPLQSHYGFIGAAGTGYGGVFNPLAAPPAFTVDPHVSPQEAAVWFKPFQRLTNGGSVTWYSIDDTSVRGNVLEVDYIARAGAGSFTVQTNINNTVWTDLAGYAEVSADNGGPPAGQVIRWTNATVEPFQVRVVGTSGTVDFPGAAIRDLTRGGVVGIDYAESGTWLSTLLASPDAVRGPILQSWAPDLILFEMPSSVPDYAANLPILGNFLKTWLPETDVVVVGLHPQDVGDEGIVEMNQILRSNALAYGWGYFDGYNLFGSFANGFDLGLLQANNVHLTSAGNAFLANALSDWLGLLDPAHSAESFASSGDFTITLARRGAFTGRLQAGGSRASFRGQFDPEGHAHAAAATSSATPLSLDFQLDLSKGTDHLTGVISNGSWTAQLDGDRAVFDGRTSRAPQAGRYTIVIPGASDSAVEPAGDGCGTITVDKAGRVRLFASLADGTKLTQTASLSRSGQWPLYAPLYSARGAIWGWISFATSPESDLSGVVNWVKPELATAKYYGGGFALEAVASGSRYAPPRAGGQVLDLAEAQLSLLGGNLAQSITNRFLLGARDRVLSLSDNRATLTFTPSTGAFKGVVVDPAGVLEKPVSFKGVVLQKLNLGRGSFLGADQSGEVLLGR